MRATSVMRPARKALPHRGVLGVDGHDLAAARRARLGDDRARGDEALLVGEREALAGFQRAERRGQAGEADDRVEHDVGVGVRGELGERLGVVEARNARDRVGTPNSRACSASRSTLRPAASPTTR